MSMAEQAFADRLRLAFFDGAIRAASKPTTAYERGFLAGLEMGREKIAPFSTAHREGAGISERN